MMSPLPRVGITLGDPAGIGPEVAEKAAEDRRVLDVCTPVLYGAAGTAVPKVDRGRVSAAAGRASYAAVQRATRDALAGAIDAMATAPVNKEAWARAGFPWRGHTDLLAELTGASDVRMMFYAEQLTVVLATVHVALKEVASLLTQAHMETTIALAHAALPQLGLARRRLAVAGLNPHAGEHGLMGDEDAGVIAPAVEACRRRGVDVRGPLPGDTVFLRAVRGEFDAVVACYHDQGLVPVKLVSFGRAVNVTLGLPIVRTSVDHGTGFDIAGQDRADPSSMIAAVQLAAKLASTRATRQTQ